MNMILGPHIEDEEKDYTMYMEMAEEFEAEGHPGEAAILRDIAGEEKIHAHYLKEIGHKLGTHQEEMA